MKKIFVAGEGIRIGWRLLIFFGILIGTIIALHKVLEQIPSIEKIFTKGEFGPLNGLLNEGVFVTSLLVTLWLMARIERRRIGDYGWRAGRRGPTRRWFAGFLFGLLMVTAMYMLQWSEHVYSFGTWALTPTRALTGGILWFLVCFLVGVFEEGVFRGYLQFTLEARIGFWATACIISLAFGMIHLLDPNYTALGIGGPAIFGLLFAFCLWRTGDLWLAMGIHSAVDFAELFIFAPAHSFPSSMHLLNADLHGPSWLTGWTIGPEASINGYAVIIIAFVIVWAGTREPQTNP